MTTDLEKQFFDTFGIEKTCNNKIINPANCPINKMRRCCGCDWLNYPQITDRILLELICVHNTYLEANLYSLDYESLGKEILEDLIEEQESRELKKDYVSDDMKQQVQALFKE